jgi:hypothetical protein
VGEVHGLADAGERGEQLAARVAGASPARKEATICSKVAPWMRFIVK